jgi:hypothetical protein
MKYERHRKYTINGRFALDPSQTAMENLCRAMDLAVLLVLTRKYRRLKGLDADTWRELRDEVYLGAIVHFIHHKVRLHKYDRKYPFLQNCISSAWSVAGNKVTQLASIIDRRYRTVSMAKLLYDKRDFFDILPDSVMLDYRHDYDYEKFNPVERLHQQAHRPRIYYDALKKDYEGLCCDAVCMGITPMSWEEYLKLNADKNGDVLVIDEREKRKGLSLPLKQQSLSSRRAWMREYQRARRARLKAERQAEYERWQDPNYEGKEGRKK